MRDISARTIALFIGSFLLVANRVDAQIVSGSVVDSASRAPVAGARVLLRSTADSAQRVEVITDSLGTFMVNVPTTGWFTAEATGRGFDSHRESVRVMAGGARLEIRLAREAALPARPEEMFIPPMPITPAARGHLLVAEWDVDPSGRILSLKFTPTADREYNQKLRVALGGMRFRPARAADGTPIRATVKMSFQM